jgi:4-hydroxy-2-oxoheptanedioate aldolase
MVNTREEAVAAVRAALYPPRGNRSVGGGAHALNFDASADDYYDRANDEILIVLQCEHIDAVENADSIFSVPGIDAIFVGPNDLAASMRTSEGTSPSENVLSQTCSRIFQACRRHKVAAGIHCFNIDQARQRLAEGWQFLAVQSELRMMLDAAETVVRQLGLAAATDGIAKY